MEFKELMIAIDLLQAKLKAGEIDEKTYKDNIDALNYSVEDTIDAYVGVVKKNENYIEYIDSQKKDLDNEKKKLKKDSEYFLSLVEKLLKATGQDRIETMNSRVFYQKSYAVKVVDQDKLPDEYIRIPKPAANKSELSKALKQGLKISGAELLENRNLQYKWHSN